ncbi:hypothetical protein BDF14DRAFT_1800943 [Spinellus fusiger]|nr:hypothetical protein BDF14DRAFT_1800943 [Spinellus fusiger]
MTSTTAADTPPQQQQTPSTAQKHLPPSITVTHESTPLLSTSTASTAADFSLSFSTDPLLRRREQWGVVLMALSALAFSAMALCVRQSARSLATMHIVLARSLVQWILSLVSCGVLRINPLGKKGVRRWLVFRALVSAVGLVLFFFSLTQLSLVEATALFFLGPTFTAMMACFFLKEPWTLVEGVCSVVCLPGILLVWQPHALVWGSADSPSDSSLRSLAVVCAVAGAVLSAVAYVSVKRVGNSTHFMVHSVYVSAVACGLGWIGLGWTPLPVVEDLFAVLVLVSVGVCAFLGQWLLNKSLQWVPAGLGTVMRISDVVGAYLLGRIVLEESPNGVCVLGVLLIVGMTTTLSMHRWYVEKSKALVVRMRQSRERLRQ